MERHFSDLIILLANGINQRRMYFDDHPRVKSVSNDFTSRLRGMIADDGRDEFSFGVYGGKFIRHGKYLVGPSIAGRSLIEFAERLGNMRSAATTGASGSCTRMLVKGLGSP